MSTTLAPKALFGILGAGAVGGTAVVGYQIFNKEEKATVKSKKTIAQLIKDSGTKTLLTAKDSSEGKFGKDAWKAYREANKSAKVSEDPGSISGFTGNYVSSVSDEKAPESFVNKCAFLSKEEVDGASDSKYIQVFNGCTRGYKVAASSFLDSDSKILLTSDVVNSHDDGKAAWEVYRKEHSATNSNPGNIKEGDTKKNQEQQNAPEDFVSKCATEAVAPISDKESPVYKSLLKYCTKSKGG